MKNLLNKVLPIIILSLSILYQNDLKSQEYKAKLSVEYNNIIGDKSFLLINSKYKFEKKYVPAEGLTLNVYKEVSEDSSLYVGNIITDAEGNAEFILEEAFQPASDSVETYIYTVKIENSEKFKNAAKSAKFQVLHIAAESIKTDSIAYVNATLTDASGQAMEDAKLEVLVHRLFAPVNLGESKYKTDKNGMIEVAVDNPLPGPEGVLTIEVKLDARKYGVVRYIFDAPIGLIPEDLSTFDERTMWSPAKKTPWFMLIFPNIVIFGIWTVIAILLFNLYKIYKS